MKKLLVLLMACLASSVMFGQLHYTVNNTGVQSATLKVFCVLTIDGVEEYNGEGMQNEGGGYLEIGVFDQDGECRGAKKPTWRSKSNQWIYSLQIKGNDGFTYSFKVYDHATETELDLVDALEGEITCTANGETIIMDGVISYVSNGIIGSTTDPYALNFTHAGSEAEVFTLTIDGYADNEDPDGGYYLIASPIGEVSPAGDAVTGMLTDAYDLFWFDQSADLEWVNYENAVYNLEKGKGYLYASETDTEIVFTGTSATESTFEVPLSRDDDANFPGWNLVGNPFGVEAYIAKPYYTLNDLGTEVMDETSSEAIPAMAGVFVLADEDGEALVFSKEQGSKTHKLSLNLVQNSSVIDRATVTFGEGQQLPKFQLRSSSTKLYIPMDGEDYAMVSSAEMGEMPVNFKAEKSGSYSVAVSTELSFNYLHLIDNKTGVDVDLLVNPVYSFEAETTDYASRFRLVFATGNSDDTFAFYSNGSFVISNEGEAVVQVMDVTGRMLSSEAISGSASINVDGAAGVYMIRLVNGENVKVQKVVVK